MPQDHIDVGGNRLDDHSCVDSSPPTIQLRCEDPMIFTQGEAYRECMADIHDKNQECCVYRLSFAALKYFSVDLSVILSESRHSIFESATRLLLGDW